MLSRTVIDEYGFPDDFEEYRDPDFEATEVAAKAVVPVHEPHVPMRTQFPEAGTQYLGGHSDGWEYRTIFGGSKLAFTYEMVRNFLQEEGYANVPIPASAEELKMFKRPRPGQMELFGERGYVHNPIKILFPRDGKMRNALIICLYNEQMPGHLVRFHGIVSNGE